MDAATRGRLRGGFDRAADSYATSRPGYPGPAVDWLLGEGASDVLDLAAGSGSLTLRIARGGVRVTAAEPSRNLLALLHAEDATIPAVQATAEALPFADRSFDVVTVATAFHWFDPALALPELARVLRPGGRLALVWNTRVATSSLTQQLNALLRSARPAALMGDWGPGSVHALDDSPSFAAPVAAEFEHEQVLDRDDLVRLVASRSYVIALDPAARAALLDRVGDLFDAHSGGEGVVRLRYRAECFRAAVRPHRSPNPPHSPDPPRTPTA